MASKALPALQLLVRRRYNGYIFSKKIRVPLLVLSPTTAEEATLQNATRNGFEGHARQLCKMQHAIASKTLPTLQLLVRRRNNGRWVPLLVLSPTTAEEATLQNATRNGFGDRARATVVGQKTLQWPSGAVVCVVTNNSGGGNSAKCNTQ